MEGNARDLCLSLEYLLRDSSVDTNVLNQLIYTMSPSLIDFRMKKNFILRNLQDDFLWNASNPENILEILEVLEEILRRESETSSNPISAVMKSVYCGVAVDCTLRCIEADKYNPAYRKTVERIWRDRVRYMETSSYSGGGGGGGSLLFSADLERWKNEIETSLLDPLVVDKLSTMPNTRKDALKKIKLCLTEAWENLGPTLLQTTFQLHKKELQLHKGSTLAVPKNNEKLKAKLIMTAAEEIDLSASCSKVSYASCCKASHVLVNEVPKTTTAAEEINLPPSCNKVNYVLIDPSATCSKVNNALISMVPPDLAIDDMNQKPQTEIQRSEANVSNPQACHSINMNEANHTRTTTVHQNDVYNSSMLKPNRATRTHEEELLRNTPLVGDYTHQPNVPSPVEVDGSISSAHILVASPSPTQYAPQDVFHTPPEDLSLPSSDCRQGNLTGDADVHHSTLNQAIDLHHKSHYCVDWTEFSNCSKFVEKDSGLGFSDARADETVVPRENVVGEGSGSKVEYGNVGVENNNKASVFDVLKFLAENTGVKFKGEGEDEGEYVGIGLLRAAKLAGITFPRPRYYPDDYESEFFNYDKGGGSK